MFVVLLFCSINSYSCSGNYGCCLLLLLFCVAVVVVVVVAVAVVVVVVIALVDHIKSFELFSVYNYFYSITSITLSIRINCFPYPHIL